MKAVATTALVLIAGAAVILWYGNTLNSWVLGGLIGGLAALLLSIPISLTLFSYFSRRHDERLRTEAQQEAMVLARTYDYPDIPARVTKRTYEAPGYTVSTEPLVRELEVPRRQAYLEEGPPRRAYTDRNLPVPASPQSLERAPFSGRVAAPNGAYSQGMRQQKDLSATRAKDAPERHTTRQLKYPGLPGYYPNVTRSQYQSAALRAARLEALHHYNDEGDVEWPPTNASKRSAPTRSSQGLSSQNNRTGAQSSSPHSAHSQRYSRTVNSPSSQPRGLPSPSSSRYDADENRYSQYYDDPETDHEQNAYRYSAPMRPQTTRHPHIEEQPRNGDIVTGSIRNPLVRRAPYMYEDDPLRQELAQQIDRPIVRRSSRFESMRNEEED